MAGQASIVCALTIDQRRLSWLMKTQGGAHKPFPGRANLRPASVSERPYAFVRWRGSTWAPTLTRLQPADLWNSALVRHTASTSLSASRLRTQNRLSSNLLGPKAADCSAQRMDLAEFREVGFLERLISNTPYFAISPPRFSEASLRSLAVCETKQ